MSSGKKTVLLKILLLVSGISFLLLIASDRISALWGGIITVIILGGWLAKSSVTVESATLSLKPAHLISGAFICGALGLNYYERWKFSSRLQALSAHMGIKQQTFLLICCIICTAAATLGVSVCLSYYISIINEDLKEKQKAVSCTQNWYTNISVTKALGILLFIFALGISAILRANFNYIDDMGRVADGYKYWSEFSRFLSDTLSTFIHMSTYLTDVSPLPQLLAVACLAVTGVMLLYIVHEKLHFSVWELIACIPLGLNPYFLECVSYKYDAPYMALSILFAVFPLLFRKGKSVAYIFISMICTVALCTTYQASSGIYPMLVILLVLKMWNNRESIKRIRKFCLDSVAGYGLGLLFFQLIIMVPVDTYVSSSLAIDKLFYNLYFYYTLISEDFKPFWIFLIAILMLGFVYTVARTSKQNTFIAVIIAMISLILTGMICFGLYPVLSILSTSPRAMYGFGVLIALVGIYVTKDRGRHLLNISSLLLGMAFFAFSFTYGNALYSQKEYTDFRIQTVINDLNDMEVFLSEQPVVVQISGSIGQSPVISGMPQNFNMLNRLVPITFQGEWWWGQAGFYQYYGLRNVIRDPSIDLTTYDLPVLEDKMYHRIKGSENYVLVELK